jgi:hypothetical protein
VRDEETKLRMAVTHARDERISIAQAGKTAEMTDTDVTDVVVTCSVLLKA